MQTRTAAFMCLVAGWVTLLADRAWAQQGIFSGMQAGVESVFSSVVSTVTFASGAVTKTTTKNVYPTLTLDLNTMLYPALRLNIGGVFEVNSFSSTTGPLTTESTISQSRPFVFLRSTNPVLAPGVGYYRREAVDRTRGASGTKLVNDEFSAYVGWKPDGGPRSDFQFLKTHQFDGDRVLQDVDKDFGSLVSQYTYRNLGLYYRGSFLNTEDRIALVDTEQSFRAVRADYSQDFFQRRMHWNATYNLNHQEFRTTVRGTGGEVAFPVTPFAGLSAVSDTPVTVTLTANGQLIDGTLTASAGIDLGLPSSPADDTLRHIGLDLLTPAEVNRFLLWVDRGLSIEVANSFSWDIYSSSDNVTWRREGTVGLAPFGAFENRFEIDFPGVTARYLKVVTRPLSAVVPDAARYADIFVTELQAFVRRSAQDASGEVTQDGYLLNTDVRFRLLTAPALYYEGYYLANGTGGFEPTTDTLSNGVSANHTFGRALSAYGRFAREQGRLTTGDRVATLTNATATWEPLRTFRTSVLYSGQDESVAGRDGSRYGVFVQNAAQPYYGIDVLFGIGWTTSHRDTGEITHDRLVNLSATVVPRERLSFTLNYDATTTDRSGTFTGPPRTVAHRSYAAVTVDPIRTLHLMLGGEVIASTGQATRTTLDIGTAWTPFPDGNLQLIYAYNEALRDIEFGKDRSTLAAVRWNVSRKSYVDLSYQRTRSANSFLTTETNILSLRVRLFM